MLTRPKGSIYNESLADQNDVTKGSSLVGHGGGTLREKLDEVDATYGDLDTRTAAVEGRMDELTETTQRSNTNAAEIVALQLGQGSNLYGYSTLAEMNGDLTPPDKAIAWVTNDETSTNNGTYIKNGETGTGSWTKSNDPASAAYQLATGNRTLLDVHVPTVQALADVVFESSGTQVGQSCAPASNPDAVTSTFTGWGTSFAVPASTPEWVFDAVEIWVYPEFVPCDIRFSLCYEKPTTGAPVDTALYETVVRVTQRGRVMVQLDREYSATDFTGSVGFFCVTTTDSEGGRLAANKDSTTDDWPGLTGVLDMYTTNHGDLSWVDASVAGLYSMAIRFLKLTDYSERATRFDALEAVDRATIVKKDTLTFTSETRVIDAATIGGSSPRPQPFHGWGVTVTSIPNAVINAIYINELSRVASDPDDPWVTLHASVWSVSNERPLVLLAEGAISLEGYGDDTSVVGVHVPLLYAGKLTELDLTPHTSIFIGYHTTNAAGEAVNCGEVRGSYSPAMFVRSFYSTDNGATWRDYSGNPNSLGIVATYLDNVQVESKYTINPDALGILPGTSAAVNVLQIPEVVVADGYEGNIYFDNMVMHSYKANNWKCDLSLGFGLNMDEKWWLPETRQNYGSSSMTCTVSVHDQYTGAEVGTSAFNIHRVEWNDGAGRTPRVLALGDSTTAAGYYTQRLVDIGASSDPMGIELIGTIGAAPNLHEGRGGWTAAKYATDEESPFVFGGVFDFGRYITENNLAVPDYVFIHLGINDVFSADSDTTAITRTSTSLDHMDTIINGITAAYPNTTIVCNMVIPATASQDSYGYNYGEPYYKWRYNRNNFIYASMLYTRYSESEVYVNAGFRTYVDPVYGFPQTTRMPSVHWTGAPIKSFSNAVHPSPVGYYQMGDAMWAYLKWIESGRSTPS